MKSSLYPEVDTYLFAGLVLKRLEEKELEEKPFLIPVHLVEFVERQGEYHIVTDSELGCGGEV